MNTMSLLVVHFTSTMSKQGKTTLASALIRRIANKGVRVCAVKHTHHPLDMRGKDSHRLHTAGAVATLAYTRGELLLRTGEEHLLERIVENLLTLLLQEGCELLVVEGLREGLPPALERHAGGVLEVVVRSLRPDSLRWRITPRNARLRMLARLVEGELKGLG